MPIVYTTNNAHDYMNMHRKADDTVRTGVCMGAAATWCKFALAENYTADPCSWSNLPDVKKLAAEYVYRVNPYAETTKFLILQMEKTMPSGRKYMGGEEGKGLYAHAARQKIIQSYGKHMSTNVKDGNGQLKLVLDIAGIVGLKVTVPDQTSNSIVSYIRDHEGIYLIFNSGHFMAASSKQNHIYFYDNENALCRCHSSDKLYETIKDVRGSARDWANVKWFAYRCHY